MNQNHEFVAGILHQGSRALAGYASQELLQKHPEAAKGFDPDPFSGWQNWLAVRVEELAAAIAAKRPAIFISQVRWGRDVLHSRGIPLESFRKGLICLRNVLAGELPEQVEPLARDYVDQALAAFNEPPTDSSGSPLPDTEMGRLASTYLLALLEGDRRRAIQSILDALDGGSDPRNLYVQVLLPAQEELGRMWAANEINVAEEHFASQTTKMLMAQLLSRATRQPPNGKTLIAAAVEGNQHDIGLQTVADFFEMDGWRTILLGANVPIRDLVQAVDCFEADLLGLSVAQATHLETVKKTIQAVRSSTRGKDVKILLGGHALTVLGDLPNDLGNDADAAGPAEAVKLGRQLVGLV